MLTTLFGEHAPQVIKVIEFVLGKTHQAMGWAYLLVLCNMVRAFFQQRVFKAPFVESLEKAFAYTMFIIMGNVVDSLMVNQMFGWQGSTQYLVCLYIIAREIKMIKDYLTQRYGIDIPILNQRLDQMEQGQVDPNFQGRDPNTTYHLNARMETLRKELEQLEQIKQQSAVGEPTPPEEPPVG